MEMRMPAKKNNIILILGENGSGKSLFAEKLAVKKGEKRIYLATMIPQTQENQKRIEKHRVQRQGKNFLTLEKSWNIDQIDVNEESVVLLEDVSNLLANGIFIHHEDVEETYRQILSLAQKCKTLIAVNIAGLSEEGYDAETSAYIKGINQLNQWLTNQAECVYRMKEGVPLICKEEEA